MFVLSSKWQKVTISGKKQRLKITSKFYVEPDRRRPLSNKNMLIGGSISQSAKPHFVNAQVMLFDLNAPLA
ncbi:MAG: hypothetical protein CMD33_04520 [Flavobacteriales bacterium]|nr:hypothetical protein [Flavobacteriales bacterium]|tara:strand:- start:395 stop:607 length:213 start_codon:yes stop_codon:yes gene_type:complete